ncbi:DUF2846 domain-containing protein [Geomonas ferrireducens]|uniref:DUF2846 domain-containing protein n=1 Tax=Geomonas ferrireducens TaxID=2570227 RepID=UPI0010A78894|nr:DUF2846 domain-containing protein [Geomonas ferrireducens]
MFKKLVAGAALLSAVLISGCASVPMASKEDDAAAKQFAVPKDGKAAVYVYRNCFVGQALKKDISLDGAILGETANKVFFYKVIEPGKHVLSTESEFGDNTLSFDADPAKNYFVEQYIKMGVFVGGSNLKMVTEEEGKKAIMECGLAQQK